MVRLNAAALDIEYAGMSGRGANAFTDRLLITAPLERISFGRKACVTA